MFDIDEITDILLNNGTWLTNHTTASKKKGFSETFSVFAVADTETSYLEGDNLKAALPDFDTIVKSLTYRNKTTTLDFLAWSYQQGIALFDSKTGKQLIYEETRTMLDFCQNFWILSQALFNVSRILNTRAKKKNNNAKDKWGKIIVYFHNLKFDIMFFRKTLIRMWQAVSNGHEIKVDDFMTDNHAWLYFSIQNVEFRCSWRLTGSSLYEFTKEMNVQHRKSLGDNDYGVHYPDEVLPAKFNKYMKHDVVGLGEALCQFMKIENLNLNELPYTSTGFPRKYVMNLFKKDKMAMIKFKASQPDITEYKIWCGAYSGGMTQANQLYTSREVRRSDIKHRDFVSFYPSMMVTQLYPSGKGQLVPLPDDIIARADLLKTLVNNPNILLACKVHIYNYMIKDSVMPFLPAHRFLPINNDTIAKTYSHKVEYLYGVGELDTTTPELKMIYEYAQQHEGFIVIPQVIYQYTAERLPTPILDAVQHYFNLKSFYKDKVKKAEEQGQYEMLGELQALLQRNKAKLNGLYGMMVEQQVRNAISIDEFGEVVVKISDLTNDIQIAKALDKYYSSNNGKCLSYLHGVYITAWAKYYLFKFCDTIGWDNVLYVDTDSAFYISSEGVESKIEDLNQQCRQDAIRLGAYTDFETTDENGNTIIKRDYLHYFDLEAEEITCFKALNAKRYLYAFTNSKKHKRVLKLTAAGISGGIDSREHVKVDKIKVIENGVEIEKTHETYYSAYDYTREMELAGIEYGKHLDSNGEPIKLTEDDFDRAFNNFNNSYSDFHHMAEEMDKLLQILEEDEDFKPLLDIPTDGSNIKASEKLFKKTALQEIVPCIFTKCGGTTAKYCEFDTEDFIVNGHPIISEGGIALFETVKALREITSDTDAVDSDIIDDDVIQLIATYNQKEGKSL